MQIMARAKYKIEEAKKDKTLSFRVPNQFYKLLKNVSGRKGVNTYAREELMDYIYSKYPESEEDKQILLKERKELEKEQSEVFKDLNYFDLDIANATSMIEEAERHQKIINKKRVDIENRIKFIDDKIRQLEEMK